MGSGGSEDSALLKEIVHTQQEPRDADFQIGSEGRELSCMVDFS